MHVYVFVHSFHVHYESGSDNIEGVFDHWDKAFDAVVARYSVATRENVTHSYDDVWEWEIEKSFETETFSIVRFEVK